MAKGDVHITWRDAEAKWAVMREGADRASSLHDQKDAAEQAGRQTAKNENAELLIHGKDGQIQTRKSYGNDPYPPRG
jgi:Uncharacterized protein conserved in bacteria (DUF2188)